MLRIAMILLAALTPVSALASTVQVDGAVTFCCSTYWSSTTTHFQVRYLNDQLPAGSAVYFRHGFTISEFVSGTPEARDFWTDLQNPEMIESGAGVWNLPIDHQTYERGASRIVTALSFVLEIKLPDGSTLWDKGSETTLGYYEVPTPQASTTCEWMGTTSCQLPVQVIQKD